MKFKAILALSITALFIATGFAVLMPVQNVNVSFNASVPVFKSNGITVNNTPTVNNLINNYFPSSSGDNITYNGTTYGILGTPGINVPYSEVGIHGNVGSSLSPITYSQVSADLSLQIYNGTSSTDYVKSPVAVLNLSTGNWISGTTSSTGTASLTITEGIWYLFVNGTSSWIGIKQRLQVTTTSYSYTGYLLPTASQNGAVDNKGTLYTISGTIIGLPGYQPQFEAQLINESSTTPTVLSSVWSGNNGQYNFTSVSNSYNYKVKIDGYSFNNSVSNYRYYYFNSTQNIASGFTGNVAQTFYLQGINKVNVAGTQSSGIIDYSVNTNGSVRFQLNTNLAVYINDSNIVLSGSGNTTWGGIDMGVNGNYLTPIYFIHDTFSLNYSWGTFFSVTNSLSTTASPGWVDYLHFINCTIIGMGIGDQEMDVGHPQIFSAVNSSFIGSNYYINNFGISGGLSIKTYVNDSRLIDIYGVPQATADGAASLGYPSFYIEMTNSTLVNITSVVSKLQAYDVFDLNGGLDSSYGGGVMGGTIIFSHVSTIGSEIYVEGPNSSFTNSSFVDTYIRLGTAFTTPLFYANNTVFKYDNVSDMNITYPDWEQGDYNLVLNDINNVSITYSRFYTQPSANGSASSAIADNGERGGNVTIYDNIYTFGYSSYSGISFGIFPHTLVSHNDFFANFTYSLFYSIAYTAEHSPISLDTNTNFTFNFIDVFMGGDLVTTINAHGIIVSNNYISKVVYPNQGLIDYGYNNTITHNYFTGMVNNNTYDAKYVSGPGGEVYLYAPGSNYGNNETLTYNYFAPMLQYAPYENISREGNNLNTADAFSSYQCVFEDAVYGPNINNNYFPPAFAWTNQSDTNKISGPWNYVAQPIYMGAEGYASTNYKLYGNIFPGAATPDTSIINFVINPSPTLPTGIVNKNNLVGQNTVGPVDPGSYFMAIMSGTTAYPIPGFVVDKQAGPVRNSIIYSRSGSGTLAADYGFNRFTNSANISTLFIQSPLMNTTSGLVLKPYYFFSGDTNYVNVMGYNYSYSIMSGSKYSISVNSTKAPPVDLEFNGAPNTEYAVAMYDHGSLIDYTNVTSNANGVVTFQYNPATMPLDPVFQLTAFNPVITPINSMFTNSELVLTIVAGFAIFVAAAIALGVGQRRTRHRGRKR